MSERRKLPSRRNGYTWHLKINGQGLYIRSGEYEDGTLGEVFIDIAKAGAGLRSTTNCWAIAISQSLQWGTPLEKIVDMFTHVQYEPSGEVRGHPQIIKAYSIPDLVVRVLGLHYLGRSDLANGPDQPIIVGPEPSSLQETASEEDALAGKSAKKTPGGFERLPGTPETPQQRERREAQEEYAKRVSQAKDQGYSGNQCGSCQSFAMKRTGPCETCDLCGATSGGCS